MTVYIIQICKYEVVGLCDPLKSQEGMLSTKSYLVDARRRLLFKAKLMGEVWLMHNADTQCTVEGRENRFIYKFFLSCHEI